jgi:hypothetical protein
VNHQRRYAPITIADRRDHDAAIAALMMAGIRKRRHARAMAANAGWLARAGASGLGAAGSRFTLTKSACACCFPDS